MIKVTLKILAKQLNLSTAAVSKALRDSHEISEVTKKRVLSLANELAYVPHPYAGSLREKRSKTIAVVIPEVADSFFSLALNGIEAVAIQKGYHALVYLTHENVDREIQILKDLEFGRVDGVLMSVTMKTTDFEHIKALSNKIPLVFFDRVCDEVDTAKITTNDYECGYQATQHLIDCGCKRISILTISNSLSISSKRMDGYMQALKDNGIEYEPELNIAYGDDSEKNYNLIIELMSRPDKPDGILATVSKMTMDIYLVAMALKINMPTELKVVCFSNESTASILNPSLTTITQPAFNMGKQAATILFKALEKNYLMLSEESLIIPSNLIVRQSTIG
jgi:LacI family transcriptional regulator